MILLAAPQGLWAQSLWIFQKYAPLFFYGVRITLLLAICGTIIGLIIGLVLGGMRAVDIDKRDKGALKILKRMMRAFVAVYVWFFRGTPMMVQAMFFYAGLKPVLGWNAITAGIVIISINTGAYMAEIIRSGIQSIDVGQKEAARSLGMNSIQTMMHIIIPQAIKNAFPSIGNELVVNIKDSSMLNVIGVIELYFQTSSVAGSIMLSVPTFLISCFIYLILTTLATQILRYIENRLNHSKTSYPSSSTMVK